MFVSPAYAQTGAAPGGADFLISMLPFVLIFVIIYFLILRPQSRRMKEHREMIGALRRGDTVVTSGGIIGKISKVVDDDELQIEVADGVRMRVVRQTISDVRSKGEPVKDS